MAHGAQPTGDWSQVAARVRSRVGARDAAERVLHPAVLRLAGRLQGRCTLDVGCGAGALVRVLAERGAEASGVDAEAAEIRCAEARAREAGLALDLRVAGLAAPASLPEGPFDLITALLVLAPAAKSQPELRTLARLLRPGGRLILAFAHPYAGGGLAERPLEGLFTSLREVGLRVVDLVEPSSDEERPRRYLVVLCERRRRRLRSRGGRR